MTMRKSRIKTALSNGAVAGTWIQSMDPTACEAAGMAGLDFVILDMEHGNFGTDQALHMIRACDAFNIDAIVRVPNQGIEKVKNALDWGAMGILLPSIVDGKMAREFVNQAKFEGEPGGKRGGCPWIRCNRYTGVTFSEYVAWCNENRQIWGIIENPQAVENIEDIASSGLNVLVMGPFDLSNSMGLKGDTEHPLVIKAFERVIKAARKNNVEVCCTLFAPTKEIMRKQAQDWKNKGVRFFTNPSPGALLFNIYRDFGLSCKSQ